MRLLLGDCFSWMPTLADQSINLVFADLPYGTTNCKWDCQLPLDDLWAEYKRLCKGAIILFSQTPFDKVLGSSNLNMLKYEWIWEKTNPTGHLNAKKMPMKAHENILVFYKNLPTYNPIKTNGHIRKTANRKKVDNSPIYGKQEFHHGYDSTDRYPRSVIKFPSDKQKNALHPTQKPVALCEYLIKTYSNHGDTVLDNVMGSGTAGVACQRLGRNFIGMEIEKQYFDLAKHRIEQEGIPL